ncbi:rhodanese-like domain-containing protein [Paenibacillus chondroitinus]|uniref:Rhodanese-like domain-containing protein n=1 Tax=Paenibacillus chondroitinus TaxID=59842 RepID=A0ABU6DLQ7_9BACL|nr:MULTISPECIES: rhodanese-like domain-containing protein [Paenibacillus]MCY9657153.1 rhodanese-like domain-containing protein [Paenibacillus anseongense]MEB4798436.1 rhodanese-like domain-containing protein [Paenibacillus chondroitinus]
MISYIFMILFVLYFIHLMKPVKDLKYISMDSFSMLLKDKPVNSKILDIRDQVDYHAFHIERAINISLGRLPYVKKAEFNKEDEIFLISDSKYQSKKAARILKRSGFENLTHVNGGMAGYTRFMNGQGQSKRLQVRREKWC